MAVTAPKCHSNADGNTWIGTREYLTTPASICLSKLQLCTIYSLNNTDSVQQDYGLQSYWQYQLRKHVTLLRGRWSFRTLHTRIGLSRSTVIRKPLGLRAFITRNTEPSQRWPRDAWAPWQFSGVPDYTRVYFSRNFKLAFNPIESILWMCVQNLKSVA